VRGKATTAVLLVTAAALTLCVGVLIAAVQASLLATARNAAYQQVTAAAARIQETGHPGDPIPGCRGLAITTTEPPPSTATYMAVSVVRTPTGIYYVTPDPDLSSARSALSTMTWLLVPGIALILLLMAILTWFAMGRALRPVESIRTEFAEITSHDLHRRVPDPGSGDEVSRLASTMNRTLHQLQRAVLRLGTFTADASHELRSPLTTLLMRLELAVSRPDHTDWPETARESLRDAEQLKQIVEDLLLLARLDTGQVPSKERIAVSDLIRPPDLIRHVSQEFSANRQLIVENDSPGAEVLGSRAALSRLLANLINNAARHARSTVRVCSTQQPGQVTIEVTDDGPGIPEADRRRVFDRFTRLNDARTPDQAGGGIGLGLAIAHDIATAHDGILSAEPPAPGQYGARLVLKLSSTTERTMNHARDDDSTHRAVSCQTPPPTAPARRT
jgi:signal transduction histidine kinase